MRVLLALIGAAAAIGLAAPADATPEDGAEEAGFLAELHSADIGFGNPSQAVNSGRAVCTCLDSGESGLELVRDLETRNPAFSMDAAAEFAVISARHFCPRQLSKS